MDGREVLEIGDVELDVGRRELRRRGAILAVQPRVFELFLYLARHRERVVTKSELLDALWANEKVVPDVLTTAFYGLRRALGDNPKKPIYIRTVHRIGYELVAEVKRRSVGHAPSSFARFPALEARHAAFVGREPQKLLFERMLSGESATQLLFVHGLPGIGKTTLLHELAYECRRAGHAYAWISGENAGPFVDSFVGALAAALGCPPVLEQVQERLAERPRVLFVDDVHSLQGVDDWLRDELWPSLPSHVKLVLAGRRAPSVRWERDPAWTRAATAVQLAPFTADEAGALLSARGASAAAAGAIWRQTRGLPLALSVAADLVPRDGDAPSLLDEGPAIDTLVRWFTDRIPDAVHLRTFEVACLLDDVSPRALAAVGGDPRRIDWLAGLPFVERAGDALRVHALVREAVVARMARRDVGRLADLLEKAHRFWLDELERAPDPAAKLRRIHSLMESGRHHPALRAHYAASDDGQDCTVQRASRREHAALFAMVERHEGEASASIVRRWVAHPRTEVWCVREPSDEPTGFLVTLKLATHDRQAAETAGDPLVLSVLELLLRSPDVDPDDEIVIYRTIISRDDYQAPSSVTRAIHAVKHLTLAWNGVHAPSVAHVVSVYAEADVWEPAATAAGLARSRECETAIGSRRFSPFLLSLRNRPVEVWIRDASKRLVAAVRALAAPPSTPSAERA